MNSVDKIRKICKERKIPISKLERDLDFSNGYIGQLRKGTMPSDRLSKVAEYLNVSPDYLLGIETKKAPSISDEAQRIAKKYDSLDEYRKKVINAVLAVEDEQEEARTKKPTKIITLIGNRFAAGAGDPDLKVAWENYSVPADSKAEFAVHISGDSMEPYLHDGSIALAVKRIPEDGEVGVFVVDGEFLVKQVAQDEYGNLYLFALNRERKDADRTLWASAEHNVRCFGTVIMKKVALP